MIAIYQHYHCDEPGCGWVGQRWLRGLPTMSTIAEGKRHQDTHLSRLGVTTEPEAS